MGRSALLVITILFTSYSYSQKDTSTNIHTNNVQNLVDTTKLTPFELQIDEFIYTFYLHENQTMKIKDDIIEFDMSGINEELLLKVTKIDSKNNERIIVSCFGCALRRKGIFFSIRKGPEVGYHFAVSIDYKNGTYKYFQTVNILVID